jgi:hypothetical protein
MPRGTFCGSTMRKPGFTSARGMRPMKYRSKSEKRNVGRPVRNLPGDVSSQLFPSMGEPPEWKK